VAYPTYGFPAFGGFGGGPYQQNYQTGYQQGAYQQAPQQPANPAAPSTVCRPVASREEAMGVPVDFMGALMVFPDLGHGKIYLKRFNQNTGAADFMEFVPAQMVEEAPSVDPFAALHEQLSELSQKIDQLRPTRRGKINDDAE